MQRAFLFFQAGDYDACLGDTSTCLELLRSNPFISYVTLGLDVEVTLRELHFGLGVVLSRMVGDDEDMGFEAQSEFDVAETLGMDSGVVEEGRRGIVCSFHVLARSLYISSITY